MIYAPLRPSTHPCIIQSVDVFFSPEDIEKGDNWDKTISSELSECKYGIICLTSDNTSAPWINFEAGAIAKSLDSKVTALMVNIKPSDIKGPLSRYQATRFERADFFQLIESINKALDTPLDSKVLENTFNAMCPHAFPFFQNSCPEGPGSYETSPKERILSDHQFLCRLQCWNH